MRLIECVSELPGWRLHFCHLRANPNFDDGTLQLAIGGTVAAFRERFGGGSLVHDGVVDAVRRRLAETGTRQDTPTPTSELVAQQILGGGDFARRSTAEDLCQLLMLKTLVPWSVTDFSRAGVALAFRLGRPGESCSIAGRETDVEGWPVLADSERPLGSPLGSHAFVPVGNVNHILLTGFVPQGLAEQVAAKVHVARLIVMTWAYSFVEEKVVSARA